MESVSSLSSGSESAVVILNVTVTPITHPPLFIWNNYPLDQNTTLYIHENTDTLLSDIKHFEIGEISPKSVILSGVYLFPSGLQAYDFDIAAGEIQKNHSFILF